MLHGQKLAIGLVVTACLLAGCATQGASAAESNTQSRTIIGTATGKIEGVPDTLTITLGVESHAGSAQDALAQNADRANKVIMALVATGLAEKDLQTTQLSLSPTYDKYSRINGYSVSNVVTAKIHDVRGGGKFVDAAVAQAGNDIQVQGITLSIEDTGKLVAAARADAVTRARAQAGQLARAAHVRLGQVEKITERRPSSFGTFTQSLRADASAAAVPVEPGTQELSVDVTVVFAIG